MPPQDAAARLLRHRAYENAYAQWFAALPQAEQTRLRGLGLDKPEGEQFGAVREDDDDRTPPEVGEWNHPSHAIEATPEDEAELGKAFGAALGWCAKGGSVVEMGRRLLVVLHIWRPSLVAGLTLENERTLVEEFRRDIDQGSGGSGSALGPVLEWARRGTSLAQLGQRFLAMAYVLRPHIIGGATLAAIGALTNKTRQAVDKLVQDFRDTFGGLRSRTMRSEANRITCRRAQLLRT